LDLETHKIHTDELRFRNTELEKELEKKDDKIKELKNLSSDASKKDNARLAGELSHMKNEVEVYKSIVQKEVDSSNDAHLKDPLLDRVLAALKGEKNKVEIYQLLLDQDVKYLNDNRLHGTLFAEGLHRNAPNKQYVRGRSSKHLRTTADCCKLHQTMSSSMILILLSLTVLGFALSIVYYIGLNETLGLLHHTATGSLAVIIDSRITVTRLLGIIIGIDLKKISDFLTFTLSTPLRINIEMITAIIKARDIIVDILWVVVPIMAFAALRPPQH
jgi:hypothetical protein